MSAASDDTRLYALRNLCSHLAASRQYDRLISLLTNNDFLREKLKIVGGKEILQDIKLARETLPIDHPLLEKIKPLENAIDKGIKASINQYIRDKDDMGSIKIFYSYSHKDEKWREILEKHLSVLKHENIIDDWHDRKIMPGTEWEKQIKTSLDDAQVILLLISPDFLASNYCWNVEVKRSIE